MNARQKGCPLSGPSFACPVNGSLGGLPERVFFWELHQSDDLEVCGHSVLIGSQERQRPIVRILPEDRGDPNDRRSSVEIFRGLRPVKCIRNQTRCNHDAYSRDLWMIAENLEMRMPQLVQVVIGRIMITRRSTRLPIPRTTTFQRRDAALLRSRRSSSGRTFKWAARLCCHPVRLVRSFRRCLAVPRH